MGTKVVFFSGAGLSAESGVPTFRDKGGLWEQYDINKVCNYPTWKNHFHLVHEFYSKRRMELSLVEPNLAHYLIAKMQEKYGKDMTSIVTQNVDDLLERAGCTDVIHVHGELTKLRCLNCNSIWDIGYVAYDGSSCPKCSSKKLVKPAVVFFSEPAPMYRNMYDIFKSLTEDDIVVILGTSGNVVSVDQLLSGFKGLKILNNLEESTEITASKFHSVFYESAITAMPKIVEIIEKKLETKGVE